MTLYLPNGNTIPLYTSDPLPAKFSALRDLQVDAARDILEAYDDGADLVTYQGPVGVGKTLIAKIAQMEQEAKGVYICSDKSLQDQFAEDFGEAAGGSARVVKGRGNYPTLLGGSNTTAEDCDYEGGDDECMWCDPMIDCPYTVARDDALRSDLAVLNTSYFLHTANYTRNFSGREFVIADEADVLEDALLGFVEFEMPRWIAEMLHLDFPVKGAHKPTLIKWLQRTADAAYQYAADNRWTLETKQRKSLYSFKTSSLVVAAALQKDLDNSGDAEESQQDRWIRSYDTTTLKLLPVTVNQFGAKNLWRHGQRWLCMSGTIISADEFVDTLGYPLDYAFIESDSPFPVENRPVVLAPVANMARSANDPDDELDKARYALERIIEKHKGRVFVHTGNYRLATWFADNVDAGRRTIVTYRNAWERSRALKMYLDTPGAIMFAPSMDRGIDLADDKCECQVIAKGPFPNMGDPRVSARMRLEGGWTWYAVQAIRRIVQASGRGVRHENDTCTMYIIDSSVVTNTWRRYKHLFPKYFRDAVDARADIRWLLRDSNH